MKCLFFIIYTFFCLGLCKAQNLGDEPLDVDEPVKIVAQTDSSIFLLRKKKNRTDRKWEFYISRHTAHKKSVDFDTSLLLSPLFEGKFNPAAFEYSILQGKENIVLLFEGITSGKKSLIGKIIDYDGKVSNAFVLDKAELSDPNLNSCGYVYALTAKKDILVTLRRSYKSGYQRDKCILFDSRFSKIWEYELPKINALKEANVITYAYGNDQLIYFVAEGAIDNRSEAWIKNYIAVDTVIQKTVAGFKYNLKVRKDSLEFLVITPSKQSIKALKVYWPYQRLPIVTSLSSSQLLLYNMVDIDDEKFVLPAKKALYYYRIDFKNNKVLYDGVIPLDLRAQNNLTYFGGAQSDRPTARNIRLIFETLADGKLISVYRHFAFDDAELFASCFDIAKNECKWIKLIPRRISTNAPELDAFTISYSASTLAFGFFENKKNYPLFLEKYEHGKYKPAKTYDGSNFISVSISEDGNMTKQIVDEASEDLLFPWLKGSNVMSAHFSDRYRFLPVKFLFKEQ